MFKQLTQSAARACGFESTVHHEAAWHREPSETMIVICSAAMWQEPLPDRRLQIMMKVIDCEFE
jgi:hypothetical protein